MKKHLLALLLVVALCVCAFAVSATETETPETETPETTKQYWSHLTVAEDGLTATGYCPHCCDDPSETVTWNKLTVTLDSHKKDITSGHYFLPEGGYFTKGAVQFNASMDVVLHLNGQTYHRNPEGGNTSGAMYVGSNNVTLSVVDDQAQAGVINGGQGPAFTANGKTEARLVLYSGTLTSEMLETSTALGGTIRLNANGNSFEMFDGTVNGTYVARGAAIYAKQSSSTATATNVVIHGGTINGGTASAYGGAIYLEYAHATLNGGTIQNGYAGSNGGNICIHGTKASLTMNGGTVKGGDAGTWGGNIGLMQTDTVFTMEGGTLDGTGASGAGENIGIYKGDVTLNGGILKNGKSDSIRLNDSADASLTLNNVTFENYGTNPANFETVLRTSTWTGNDGSITIGNFNSTVNFDYTTDETTENFEFNVGLELHNVTVSNTYTGNGSLWAYIDGGSRKPCVVDGTALKLGGLTAFDADGKEVPVSTLGGDEDVAYYKMYANGEFTLAGDAIVDMNNAVVDFKTNGNKLTVIDYRTDSGVVAKFTKFTVDNEDNLNTYGINPVNGYQYICIKGEDGKWTSNRVQVTLDKLSIKTTQAGVYYTTTIRTNANVAPYIVSYGTAASIVEMPTSNFVNQLSVLYTEYDMKAEKLDENGNLALTTRSALIADIVKEDVADNGNRSQTPIYANSFMIINTGAGNTYIMADQTFDLSLNDAMMKLDAKLDALSDEQLPVAVNFYTKWLAKGAFTGVALPKLEEAAA